MGTLTNQLVTPVFEGEYPLGCGPINKDGIYRISNERYHEGPCVEPSLSASGIQSIISRSPKYFYANSPMNPDRPKREDKSHFKLGSLVHTLILERDSLHELYHVSEYKSLQGKAAQAEKALIEKQGITWITEAQLNLAEQMVLHAAPELIKFFEGCVCETSLIWQDKVTGVWLRVRPDGLPLIPQGSVLGDYKTTRSASFLSWQRSQGDYGYHISGWLYQEGVREVLDAEPSGYAFFIQEKEYPYEVAVYDLPEEDLQRGRLQARLGIEAFARCRDKGEWPGLIDLGLQTVPLSNSKRGYIDGTAKAVSEDEPQDETVSM